jgi:hypothetical protein
MTTGIPSGTDAQAGRYGVSAYAAVATLRKNGDRCKSIVHPGDGGTV